VIRIALSLLSFSLLLDTSHACFHDIDTVRRHKSGTLYKENFNETNQCITSAANRTSLNEEFIHLKTRFPYDRNLDLYHARTKLTPGSSQFLEGMNEFCQCLYLPRLDDDKLPSTIIPELLTYLKSFTIDNQNIGNRFQIIQSHIATLKSVSDPMNSGTRRNTHNQAARARMIGLEKNVIDSFKDLYEFLKQNQAGPCADALADVVFNTLTAHHFSALQQKLTKALYQIDKKPSDFLTKHYAQHLVEQKQYEQAIPLCTPLVGTQLDADLPFQGPHECNVMLIAHFNHYLSTTHRDPCAQQQYKAYLRAQVELFEDLLGAHHQNDLRFLMNICYFYLHLEDYQKSREYFSKIMDLPQDLLLNVDITRHKVETLHQLLADKTGDLELTTNLLLARQQRALAKNKKIASYIKAFQEAVKATPQKSSQPTSEKQSSSDLSKSTTKDETSESVSGVDHTSLTSSVGGDSLPSFVTRDDGVSPVISDRTIRPKKTAKALQPTKIKTRPQPQLKAQPQNQAPQLQPQAQPQQPSILYVEDITTNKHAILTFYTLFSKYHPDIKSDKKVTISLHEIQALFKALGQNYDPKAGKGSHKKGTLKFEETTTPMDEQMVVLTKATYLKPYQIKKLRAAFIKAGLFPNDADILAKLRAEGLL
jgi:hypothetical protein